MNTTTLTKYGDIDDKGFAHEFEFDHNGKPVVVKRDANYVPTSVKGERLLNKLWKAIELVGDGNWNDLSGTEQLDAMIAFNVDISRA